jgi:hypothetical protein
MENESLKWQTYEYVYKHRNVDWYWALFIIAMAIAVVAIMLENVLFAITILVGALSLALMARRKPALLSCELTDKGIRVNEELYPYSKFSSFGIEESNGANKLIIKSKRMMGDLMLPIEKTPDKYKEFLSQFLEEEEVDEPLAYRLLEYIGF